MDFLVKDLKLLFIVEKLFGSTVNFVQNFKIS